MKSLIRKIKNYFIRRKHKKFMSKGKFSAYWGTVKMENGEAIVDETCSFGPWVRGEQIDITGNKEIP